MKRSSLFVVVACVIGLVFVWFPRAQVNVEVPFKCEDRTCPSLDSSAEDKVERGFPAQWSEVKTKPSLAAPEGQPLFYDKTEVKVPYALFDFFLPVLLTAGGLVAYKRFKK